MKHKKIISLLSAAVIMVASSITPAFVANASEIATESIEENTSVGEDDLSDIPSEVVPAAEAEFLSQDEISIEDLGAMMRTSTVAEDDEIPELNVDEILRANVPQSTSLTENNISLAGYNLESGSSMGILTSNTQMRSAASITQQFTDFITTEDDIKLVQFSLGEGDIVNASLSCPNNENLNYDLVLASVAEDGSLNLIKASALGTYIDSNTKKTVDEGISYVHNQATVGNFAMCVLSSNGSSSSESFTLTISLDEAGSFDSNEPNESAFEATSISGLTGNGSLHVENDQDWYIANVNQGVYEVTAGNYQAEIYRAIEGNRLVKADMAGSNYVLDSQTYFIKVYSDATGEDFSFGDYTLQLVDKSVYSTMRTAYDFGDWEHAYTKLPDVIPKGQQQAYYKFSIDSEDKVYASLLISESNKGTLIEFLDNNGEGIDYGFSGSDLLPDIPVRGLVPRSNSSYSNLVVNVDGTQTNNVAYIRVTKVDPMDISGGGSPSIRTRIHSGYGSFTFSGTASNPGNSTSTVLTMNLANNSNVPPHAIVDRISTKSNISYSVGGVHHQLNPGGLGWITSAYTSAESGSFNIGTENNIEVGQLWGFRYTQTAFMNTTMSRVEMTFHWDYDIQYTNYELFK